MRRLVSLPATSGLTLPCLSAPPPLQEYVYPDARDRQYLLFFHKGVKRTRFDIEKYNKLKDDIAQVWLLALWLARYLFFSLSLAGKTT